MFVFFFFSSRRRHTRFDCDWSSDVCSSDLGLPRRRPCPALPPGAYALPDAGGGRDVRPAAPGRGWLPAQRPCHGADTVALPCHFGLVALAVRWPGVVARARPPPPRPAAAGRFQWHRADDLPAAGHAATAWHARSRSEEHTSELQSQSNLVCRLLLEKKKKNNIFCGSCTQMKSKHSLIPHAFILLREVTVVLGSFQVRIHALIHVAYVVSLLARVLSV